MTTFEYMLKKRPIDPEILEEKVRSSCFSRGAGGSLR